MLSLPLAFDLVPHGIGTNAYGEEVTSCVLVELVAPADEDFEDQYTERERAALDVLKDQADGHNPVKEAAWRRQLEATSPFQGISNEKTLQTAIRRARTTLVDKGVASYDEQKQLLTYIGEMEGDTENA